MTETIMVDPELARQALGDVLDADAAAQPAQDPPPRRPPPPDATAEAPWGFKADGTPRKGPPGPGRPRKDKTDQARVTDDKPPAGDGKQDPQPAQEPADYTADITGALTMVWMGASALPWTRGHAGALYGQIPALAPAWSTAAQHNAAIRRYVVKFSGQGSLAWVIPVTVSTSQLVLALWEVTRNAELRAELARQNDEDFRLFVREQAEAAGMVFDDEDQDQAEDAPEPQAA